MSAIFLKTKKCLPREAKRSRGITLIETILYIILLMIVTSVIVEMLIAIGGVYKNIKVTRELESSGTIVMESMLREIRNAAKVEIGSSILDTSPGVITLSGIDKDLNPYTVSFRVSSGAVVISRNGGPASALTSSSGQINWLVFTRVSSANSEGVRIELKLVGSTGKGTRSESFYGFTTLRGSY